MNVKRVFLFTFQNDIDEKSMKNIVVVGGGAGGLEFVTQLSDALKKNEDISITLIDKAPSHIWKPLLHEVAVGTLNVAEEETNYYDHAKEHDYHFMQGELINIDHQNKTVQLKIEQTIIEDTPLINYTYEKSYDVLVLAVGSKSNDFGTPGVADNCYFLDDIEQAKKFQKNKMTVYKNSHLLEDEPVFNIAIIGGGATGIEFAAELAQAKHTLFDYGFKKIRPENINIHLIEGGNRLINTLSEQVSIKTKDVLLGLDINVLTDHQVKSIEDKTIHFSDGFSIQADSIIWAAGIKAPKVLESLVGFEKDNINRLKVHATLQTFTDPSIFAFGDCAHCQLDSSEKPLGARAQVASQQAEFLVHAVICYLNGKSLPMFKFNEKGTLVSLSEADAVGQILGDKIVKGQSARMMYQTLYRIHQTKIHGIGKTMLITAKDLFARRVNPKIKLH